jgi:hypothetical protein
MIFRGNFASELSVAIGLGGALIVIMRNLGAKQEVCEEKPSP